MRGEAQRGRGHCHRRIRRPADYLRDYRRAQVRRLCELYRKYRNIRIVVDSVAGASAIEEALAGTGIDEPISVLIDVDVGLHRTGIAPGEPAVALARHVSTLKT